MLHIFWLVSQGREIQVNYSSKPSHLKRPVFISGYPVAIGSHNLFARAPAGAHPQTEGSRHRSGLSFTGRDVCSWSLSPFTASPIAFSVFPERNSSVLHPTRHPAPPPPAPHHPKGGGFFGVNWLCLVSSSPFSPFLLLHQLPAVSASCSQTLFGGQTLKLCPSLPSSTTPLTSTQKTPGNSQGTSSITKSSAYLCVSFQQSYCDSRKSQLRL